MTVLAVGRELTVWCLGFDCMALRARGRCVRARMRFVTVTTSLVSCRSRGQLLLVAAAARRGLRAAVRLVTADALCVPLAHLRALVRVTALTANHRQLRVVGEPDVAPFAGLVPAAMGCAG